MSGDRGRHLTTGFIVKFMHRRLGALSVVALLATAPAAYALDANDFAGKLKNIYAGQGSSLLVTLGASTVSGNNITFDGLTLGSPLAPAQDIKLNSKLTFENVAEQADGSYTADALTFPDADFKFDGGELTIKNIAFKQIFVPSGKNPDVLDSSRFVGSGTAGPFVLALDGQPAFSMDSVTVNNTFKPSQAEAQLTEIDSVGTTQGFKFDMSQAKDKDALAQAKALDLVTVTGKLLESVNWTLADGHLNISELSADVDKVGKLKFSFDMTGYTAAFLKNLTALSEAMTKATGGSGQANQQAATAMLLASLQTLFLNSASLRFDDASITAKLIDMGAKQANVDRAKFIDTLVAQVPASMNEGESQPLPVQVTQTAQAAVRAYLNDPHSIEIRLAPKTPLGILGIVGAAMAPQNLVDQIGLKILVNDKEITPDQAAKETGTSPAAPTGGDNSTAPATDDNSGASSSDDNSGSSSDDSSSSSSDDNSSGAASDNSGSDDNAGADDSSGTDRLTTKHNH